jgi:hypothetical protein
MTETLCAQSLLSMEDHCHTGGGHHSVQTLVQESAEDIYLIRETNGCLEEPSPSASLVLVWGLWPVWQLTRSLTFT